MDCRLFRKRKSVGVIRLFSETDCSVVISHDTQNERKKTLHGLSLSLSFYLSVLSLLDG